MSNEIVEENQKKPTLWNKNYILCMLVNVCLSLGFYFFQPTLSPYMISLGITISIAGIVTGLFSFAALVARPFTGMLADRIRPKSVLMFALPLEAVFGALYGLFASVGWIVLCRIGHSVGFSFASTVTVVYGSFFVPKERMGEGIGYLGLGNVLGTAIGPSIGLALCNMVGYRFSFVIGGAIFAVGFLLILLTKPPKKSAEEIEEEKRKRSEKKGIDFSQLISVKLIPLSTANALITFAYGVVTSFIALHAAARGIGNVGLYFTVLAVVMLVSRPLAGKLNDKKGLGVIAVPCAIFTAIALVVIASATALPHILIGAAIMALGAGTCMPAFQTACVRAVPDSQRGVAISTYYILQDVLQGLAPTIGGFIVTATSFGGTLTYGPLYIISSGVALLGLVIYLIYAGVMRKKGVKL